MIMVLLLIEEFATNNTVYVTEDQLRILQQELVKTLSEEVFKHGAPHATLSSLYRHTECDFALRDQLFRRIQEKDSNTCWHFPSLIRIVRQRNTP
jgi:hypothetical protein